MVKKTASKLLRPRLAPIITTLNKSPNASPMSYIGIVASKPEIIALGADSKSDTYKNICLNKEFIVNIISIKDIKKYWKTRIKYPYGTNELKIAGFKWRKGVKVKVPYITSSIASIECKSIKKLKIADRTVIFGKVIHVRVSNSYSLNKVALHHNKGKFFKVVPYIDFKISEKYFRKGIGK